MGSSRLFLAIPLKEEATTDIKEFIDSNKGITNIRWTKTENLHLTGYFLGNVDDGLIDEIDDQLLKVASITKEFDLQFQKFMVIPKPQYPKMIWARFRDSESYVQLSNNIQKYVSEIVELKEQVRKPVPHITIGRFKKNTRYNFTSFKNENNLADMHVDQMELWESKLHSEGPIYSSLKKYKLDAV
ncbi:MAG: RNA 2',3'-cyclic phosphodiesterase [Bacteroidetes bacterium]|nr:RNA 2',3'-cyclic phosphodiesterase [Bacteroidota bacterium]